MRGRVSFFAKMLIPLLLVYIGPERTACAQQPGASAPIIKVPLSQEQVVENLVAMDLKRVHALNAFQGTQFYRLEYHGFGGTRSAEMTVDVKYRSPNTKEFTIRSATGSMIIVRKVFKKLLRAEKEAMEVENRRRDAINNDNYSFTQMEYDSTPSGSMYVLGVKPKTEATMCETTSLSRFHKSSVPRVKDSRTLASISRATRACSSADICTRKSLPVGIGKISSFTPNFLRSLSAAG